MPFNFKVVSYSDPKTYKFNNFASESNNFASDIDQYASKMEQRTQYTRSFLKINFICYCVH
jgi:hypothetical protein